MEFKILKFFQYFLINFCGILLIEYDLKNVDSVSPKLVIYEKNDRRSMMKVKIALYMNHSIKIQSQK